MNQSRCFPGTPLLSPRSNKCGNLISGSSVSSKPKVNCIGLFEVHLQRGLWSSELRYVWSCLFLSLCHGRVVNCSSAAYITPTWTGRGPRGPLCWNRGWSSLVLEDSSIPCLQPRDAYRSACGRDRQRSPQASPNIPLGSETAPPLRTSAESTSLNIPQALLSRTVNFIPRLTDLEIKLTVFKGETWGELIN